MSWTMLLGESAWKGTVLLLAACIAAAALRREAASIRHFVWVIVFVSLAGLPLAISFLPHWQLLQMRPASRAQTVPTAPSSAPVRVLASGQSAPPEPSRAPEIVSFIWLIGCLAVASRFLAGATAAYWMVRRATPAVYAQPMLTELAASLHIRRRVRALQSDAVPMPLTWGTIRPVVLLPENASVWPEERMRTVMLHELIHVSRFDLLAQTIAQIACSLYWFQPLAWVGWRQLRKEREHACDDAVLARGIAAHEYAGHLLDLVRTMAARRQRWADAPAMAESSDLESRVRALLDRNRNRCPLTLRAALTTATALVAVLTPLAAIHAQQARGWMTGSVSDPSGARIPQCRVIARNQDGTNQETTVTDALGEYRFDFIPAGRYSMEFVVPGFAMAKVPAVLGTGATARVDARLELGAVSEMLVVRAPKPPSATAPPSAVQAFQAFATGGNVEPAKLIRQPRPVYPPELQQLGVEGTVVMSAIISKDGTVLNPEVRNTVDPRLATAALDAVKRWMYKPALLNGEPVETVSTITLEFQLGQ
ncbi:MAG TPA: M56 family metallopeptidase [Bryobacteraceae bacterium]|nr:M56 family metallopeptidase [Bryobacteraceae bacterium]